MMAGGRILHLVQPEVGPFDPRARKPHLGSNRTSIGQAVPEMWPFEIFQAAILDLVPPEVGPVDPSSPKTLP